MITHMDTLMATPTVTITVTTTVMIMDTTTDTIMNLTLTTTRLNLSSINTPILPKNVGTRLNVSLRPKQQPKMMRSQPPNASTKITLSSKRKRAKTRIRLIRRKERRGKETSTLTRLCSTCSVTALCRWELSLPP